MSEFKNKKQYKFWHSPIFLVVLLCVLVLFSFNVIKLVEKERETNKNKLIELNRIEELREREMSLSSDIEKLNTEKGIEDTIRNKFQVAKPGEKVVAIVDEETPKIEVVEKESHGFWLWMKNVLK